MTKTKVIIAGGGIAGPVLGIFLSLKGYDPVIYERTDKDSVDGLAMMLHPNGLRVLSLIPHLIDRFEGHTVHTMNSVSVLPEDEGMLASTDMPVHAIPQKYGFPMTGVKRAPFRETLLHLADEYGVKVHYGNQVVGLDEKEDEVRVRFANGETDTASFVVGCDGLHSDVRAQLFGKEDATFTGLTQVSGFTDLHHVYGLKDAFTNFFGEEFYIVAYQVNDTHIAWALTLREPEAKETWRSMSPDKQEEFKHSKLAKLGYGVGDMIKGSEDIIRYGLYDRPELKTWHKGRVVLLGDAAHPTSPHLGQGANQAFEDIYHLIRALSAHNSDAHHPSTSTLEAAFAQYESARIPRTAALVAGARAQGEARVVKGVEACKARNAALRKLWADEEVVIKGYEQMIGPYEGKLEV